MSLEDLLEPDRDENVDDYRDQMAGNALGFARQQVLYRYGKNHANYRLADRDWNRIDELFTELNDTIMSASIIEK